MDLPFPVLGFPNRSLLMSPPELAELLCCCPPPGRLLFFLSFVMSSLNMSPVRNAEMRSSNSPSPFPLPFLLGLCLFFLLSILCGNKKIQEFNKTFELSVNEMDTFTLAILCLRILNNFLTSGKDFCGCD